MAIRLKTSLVNPYEMDLEWCFQETWLQTGTVRENITMGNPTISEEEMIRIAQTLPYSWICKSSATRI